MRKTSRILLISAVLLLLIPVFVVMAQLEDQSEKLELVFEKMDKASRTFESFKADISTRKYTAVLEEFDPPENGLYFYKRAGDGSALVRWEIKDPAEKITTIRNDEVTIYQPKIKYANIYKLGKHRNKTEYLALGLGQAPSDLKEKYHITFKGGETINGDACSILEFRPKDPEVASTFSSITVWVKDVSGISTQMKLVEPYEDYLLVNFSNEKLNSKIDNSIFKQDLPGDVEVTSR